MERGTDQSNKLSSSCCASLFVQTARDRGTLALISHSLVIELKRLPCVHVLCLCTRSGLLLAPRVCFAGAPVSRRLAFFAPERSMIVPRNRARASSRKEVITWLSCTGVGGGDLPATSPCAGSHGLVYSFFAAERSTYLLWRSTTMRSLLFTLLGLCLSTRALAATQCVTCPNTLLPADAGFTAPVFYAALQYYDYAPESSRVSPAS